MREPSKLEREVGIMYADLTDDERRAVDRIRRRYDDMTMREKGGSPTDIIMDLSVAIVAELRKAQKDHR